MAWGEKAAPLSHFVGWAETLGGFLAIHSRNCRSKKVRATFNNSDHTKLDGFCKEFVCSLAQPVSTGGINSAAA
ncbi:hypothetical protein B6D52_02880 [Candidatus Parcubacteria bacterium 4484_255]|nr:MAG: hypothetical protein B6D52_02880 [Candidatus Parcubacteria bacterium 4484_255]